VQLLLQRVTEGAIISQVLAKVNKAAKRVMTEFTIQNVTNLELIKLNKKKTHKANRDKGNYGVARYLRKDISYNETRR